MSSLGGEPTEAGAGSVAPGPAGEPAPPPAREPAAAAEPPQDRAGGDAGPGVAVGNDGLGHEAASPPPEGPEAAPDEGLPRGLPGPGGEERPAPDSVAKTKARVQKVDRSAGEEGAEKPADEDAAPPECGSADEVSGGHPAGSEHGECPGRPRPPAAAA